ncbi:hypothetical protein [Salinarimonas chemoclinalis]|uniref:hypothetical protein n=1 Tax=Salinarimonas chemoclinalis TaxID=3241599 RepID=UPI0035579D61
MAREIVVGIVLAAVSGLVSWFLARATYDPPRPRISVSPSEALVPGLGFVEFTTEATPAAERPSDLRWLVGGLEPTSNPAARCTRGDHVLRCQFLLPGIFAVSVTHTDRNGNSASAASRITVRLRNGYLAFLLMSDDPQAEKAFFYGVDWTLLQSLTTTPIVLEHPETGMPTFASNVEQPAENGSESWRGAAAGLKIAVPPIAGDRDAFMAEFERIGLVPVVMALGEVLPAQTAGAVDAGFALIDSPTALPEFAERVR